MLETAHLNKITEAMKQLSQEHQDVLILIDIKGMTYADAAKALKRSKKAVRFVLSFARQSLRTLLDTPCPNSTKIYINPCILDYKSCSKAA